MGHVDHGKSTLIGRIFHDTHSLPDGKVEQIQKACREEGMEFEYAFLLDALLEEQEQNITIDTTQIQFKTAKRPYVIIDAPGHKEFLKNMITGAASADAAVLLIAANEGVREQSRRHGYLLSLLGIKQVVVAVNKMDLVGYQRADLQRRGRRSTGNSSTQIGLEARTFVPDLRAERLQRGGALAGSDAVVRRPGDHGDARSIRAAEAIDRAAAALPGAGCVPVRQPADHRGAHRVRAA